MTAIPLSHDLTGMIVHFSNLIIACDILSQMDVNNCTQLDWYIKCILYAWLNAIFVCIEYIDSFLYSVVLQTHTYLYKML